MGTESHGGDGGLLEDGEDGITTVPLSETHRAARSFRPGGGRRAGGAVCAGAAAAPSEEQEREQNVRTDLNASSQLSNVPLETLRGI